MNRSARRTKPALRAGRRPASAGGAGFSRAGIVGFCCATGLGYATWDFYRHLPFSSWLVAEHPDLGLDSERIDSACRIYRTGIGGPLVEDWLHDLNTVFTIEREYIPGLWRTAKKLGVRIVFMPNAEWFQPGNLDMELIDTFVAPTLACEAMLGEAGFGRRTQHVPHPVDTVRFKFRRRDRAETFVHFRGWGGYLERKGTEVVVEAARRCAGTPFVIRCQKPFDSGFPDNVQVMGPTADPCRQYLAGDVAVQPSRWEGVGLAILEAMACGMPAIVPDAPPMNEYPADRELLVPAQPVAVTLARDWTAWETDPCALAETIRTLQGREISEMSSRARARMELRSWERLQPELARVVCG